MHIRLLLFYFALPILGSTMWKSETLSSVMSAWLPTCRCQEIHANNEFELANKQERRPSESWTHVPLKDGRRQHSARTQHLVAINDETLRTVAVDQGATARLLLHD